MPSENQIGAPLSFFNFNYKLFVEKYVPNIVLPNIPYFDESNLVVGGKFLDVPFMYRPIRSLHLKVLRSESNALHEKL